MTAAHAAPQIYSPTATTAQAVDSNGKTCEPDEFASGSCKEKKKKKKKSSKKGSEKKSSSDDSGGGSSSGSSSTGTATTPTEVGLSSGVVGSDTNWLKTNGLSSPICKNAKVSRIKALRQNCARSGVASVPTPTGNLGFDVHIDTGITKPGNWFASLIHNLANIGWVLMVNVTAAMFAALEWAFSLNLLDGSMLGGIGQQLQAVESAWTTPIARMLMACFGVWVVYYAAVRRQMRMVMSELVSSVAMSLVVLAIIANPVGTVGAVNNLSNSLALYALNTIQAPANLLSGKKQSSGAEGYSEALAQVYDSVVVRSWALLEFGNVEWATSPKKLDPEIKKAAKALAADKSESVQQAVSDAKTNAAVFLAFPPNTAERDGINDIDGKTTLLRILCDNDDVTKCKGKYKSLADQRTASGTDARAGQMLLVFTGLMCIWIILGILSIGLLGAAAASIFYLILVTVTAPLAWFNIAGGKRKFQQYLVDLGGSLFAKLLYAVGLAIVMMLFNVIVALKLSFFMQWLLMIAAFWFLFKRRKELLGVAPGVLHPGKSGRTAINKAKRISRKASSRTRETIRDKREKRRERLPELTDSDRKRSKRQRGREASEAAVIAAAAGKKPKAGPTVAADPAAAMVDVGRRRAIGRGHQANHDLQPLRARLGRVSLEEVSSGQKLEQLQPGTPQHKKEARRHESLVRRRTRLDRAVDTARRDIDRGRDVATRPVDAVAERTRAARVIEQQAMQPATNRDYRRLASMANITPEAYDQLGGRERNEVRSAINQELRASRTATSTPGSRAGEFAANQTAQPGPAERAPRSGSELNRERVGGKRTRPAPRRPQVPTGRSG